MASQKKKKKNCLAGLDFVHQELIGTQCWGKLLFFKIMHYNIALLHKNNFKKLIALLSSFLWKVMHYITFELLFFTWAGLANLIYYLNQNYISGNCKGPFTPKVKSISFRPKEVPQPLHLTPNFSQHGDRRGVNE